MESKGSHSVQYDDVHEAGQAKDVKSSSFPWLHIVTQAMVRIVIGSVAI
jgi:hypothetical protein